MLKKFSLIIMCAAVITLVSGCANRPVRNFFRGALCNTCQPPVGQPLGCGTNYAPGCDSGACGTGLLEQPTISTGQPVLEAPAYEAAPSYIPTDSYSANPAVIQPNISIPQASPLVDPFGMPESATVYGNEIGSPSPPAIGPSQGSGTR